MAAAEQAFSHTISDVLCFGISTTGGMIRATIFGRDIFDFCIRLLWDFTAIPSPFNENTLEVLESNGSPVEPESLFEAQLALRLGKLPIWLNTLHKEWETLRKIPLSE